MRHVSDHAPWRANFIGTLDLLGRAALRQPYGIPDPVLCGGAAVELYTGGLCTADCLEVSAADARSLTAELFAAGFRWTQRTRRIGRGLWHPDLQIGMDIIEVAAAGGLPGLSNELTVAIDLGPTGLASGEMISLKVIAIEDLIVEEVTHGLMRKAPSGEVSARVRELVGLGRIGVAGRLRTGYLQRRVTSASDGEVVFEASLPEEGADYDGVPRLATLSQMRTLISAWRTRRGYSSDQPGVHPACRPKGIPAIRRQNVGSGRAGGLVPANVIQLDDVPSTPPE